MNYDQAVILLHRHYLDSTGWKTPTVEDCSRFVMQEAAETDSALMKAGFESSEHSRNNPVTDAKHAMRQVRHEIGQTYVMLLSLANLIDVDLTDAGREFIHEVYLKHMADVDHGLLREARDAFAVLQSNGDVAGTMEYLNQRIADREDDSVALDCDHNCSECAAYIKCMDGSRNCGLCAYPGADRRRLQELLKS